MENFNKHAPCIDKSIDKNCSFCCNPVKIDKRIIVNGLRLPKDKNGKSLWKERDEILAPEDTMEKVKIATFDCINYDENTGKCLDYENRPEICRNTTCITDQSGDVDDQHKKVTEVKFVKIK